jgi:hypothetical protein
MTQTKYRNAQIGSSSHKPHKHRDPGSSKPNGSNSKSGTSSDATNISFLFCVNEFDIDFETAPLTDQWLNYMPPTDPIYYRGEYPGTVFRYRAGTIAPAPNYVWSRSNMGEEGRISYVDPTTGFITIALGPYKTETIFSCSAHLPIITLQSDASLGSSLPSGAQYENSEDDIYKWTMLHFASSEGISLANSRRQGCTCIAGKNASWIPSLVPRVFENTYRHETQRSRGLGGDLPVVIGLMAFHASRTGNASAVFERGWWQRGQWRGPSEAPRGCELFCIYIYSCCYWKREFGELTGLHILDPEQPYCNPRGFLVQISPDLTSEQLAALEMGHDYMDTVLSNIHQALENLESNGILVEG